MDPTLGDGEWLFVNKAITYLKAPKRGEIVILKEPEKLALPQHPLLVKRVIAIAGDEVQSRAGALYVNGDKVDGAVCGYAHRGWGLRTDSGRAGTNLRDGR